MAGAIVEPDVADVLVAVALVCGAIALMWGGAPFARDGRPSAARVALLFAAAVAGVVLTVAVGPLVAIGVVAVAYAIAILSMARWPPRGDGPPAGAVSAVAGAMVAFLAVVAAIAGLTDSRGLAVALVAVATVATYLSFRWIAFRSGAWRG